MYMRQLAFAPEGPSLGLDLAALRTRKEGAGLPFLLRARGLLAWGPGLQQVVAAERVSLWLLLDRTVEVPIIS